MYVKNSHNFNMQAKNDTVWILISYNSDLYIKQEI